MEKIIITEEIMQKESIKEWAGSFQLGTAGYRDILNPDNINDPTVNFNRVKVALMAEARARVLKRECGESGLCLHVGGEVRPHTREFIDLVSRIYAGHGIRVHRRSKGKTTPIWYSSFGTFYEELTGGENFTASHSQYFKGGWKPMDGEGKQLLEMAGRIAEEVGKISIAGTEILLAPLDSELILDDFDVTVPYTEYLKTIVKEENILAVNEAGKSGFKAFFATLGGSMAVTALEIFNKLGLQVGDDQVLNFLFSEEDPAYHNIGMVDGVNHGVDPGKWQVYKNIGAQNILANRLANVVFLWDPDGDRFNMVTRAPVSLSEKASDMGMEVEPLPGDPKNICVYFKPCQIYFMLMAWLLEQLKESGELKKRDWIIMETFPTSRSIAELGEKFGLKVFFTPVGFKHFGHAVSEIEKALESGAEEGDDDGGITIEDSLGQENDIGLNPRVLAMMEESGGAAMGGAEFIKSRNGKRKALAIREKDGMQIGLVSLALAAELFKKKSSFAAYYLEAMDKYEIRNRYYHREDLVLYDEGIKDRSEREKAKAEGFQKRDSIVSFFKDLAEKVRKGDASISEAVIALNKKQSFMEFDSLRDIYWAGDGTFLEFPDFWVGIRASGTDAVMRYYMEGTEKYILNKVSRAIMSIE